MHAKLQKIFVLINFIVIWAAFRCTLAISVLLRLPAVYSFKGRQAGGAAHAAKEFTHRSTLSCMQHQPVAARRIFSSQRPQCTTTKTGSQADQSEMQNY
jgi:hypothetical protein